MSSRYWRILAGICATSIATLIAAAISSGAGLKTSAPFRACAVLDGPPTDRSFNQSAWEGVQAAEKSLKIQGQYVVASSQSAFTPTIASVIRRGCGIVITVGFPIADATKRAALANPKQRFAIVDNVFVPPIKNVSSIAYLAQQPSYLAGYLAAGMSKTHVVGVMSGMKIPPNLSYLDGFWDGVQKYNAVHHTSVKVLGWNEKTQNGTTVGSYSDTGAAAQIASTMIDQHADIIFPVAGGASLGAARVVQQRHARLLWFDVDGCVSNAQYCPEILATPTKAIAVTVEQAIAAAKSGKARGGTYLATLANNGVKLVYGKDLGKTIPQSLKHEIAQLAKQIASGKLKVASKYNPAG